LLEINSMRRHYKPPALVERRSYLDFTIPTNRPKLKNLYAATDYLCPDPVNRVIFKQRQSVTKGANDPEMSTIKALTIFVALSAMLLIGIGLLPKTPQITVPAPTATVTTAATAR